MKRVHGTIIKCEPGTLREKACVSATVGGCGGNDDTLHVVRPTMKQAVAAINRLMKKLGWALAEPWEHV